MCRFSGLEYERTYAITMVGIRAGGRECEMKEVVICIIILCNLIAFALMGIDKYKAIHNRWRIPEKTLFMSAIPFSALGAILGMKIFHHKTKHRKFVIGMPVIFIVQIALVLVYFLG